MTFFDLLKMSLDNLLRRKLRTVLTVLGVIIGTASIVVMLSLGLGLKRTSLKQIEQYGGVTTVNVYAGEGQPDEEGKKKEEKRLDDKLVTQIAQIPHVELVSPVLQIDMIARFGKYQSAFSVKGMTGEALRKMNLKIGKGGLPPEDGTLQLFFGNQVQNNFYNPRGGNAAAPAIDFMRDQIFYILDTESYYQSQNTQNQGAAGTVTGAGSGDNAKPVSPPKKYQFPACGVLAGGPEEYNNNSYEVYADLEALKAQVKKAFKNKAIPGQPTNKKGKPYKELFYNSLYVRVDHMKYVEEVQKSIKALGVEANSNIEWLKQTQEQMKTIQMTMGGIGAVSLFVAAIGIANTMMMSIYERTKEIGILKVLGCELSDIRKMFLMEAGFIGFSGGFIGLILSFCISAVINTVAGNSAYQGISYIPLWLVLLAQIFSVVIGMTAGLMPALRAMSLSPLTALRNE